MLFFFSSLSMLLNDCAATNNFSLGNFDAASPYLFADKSILGIYAANTPCFLGATLCTLFALMGLILCIAILFFPFFNSFHIGLLVLVVLPVSSKALLQC